jgi:hypothetical protein
LFCVPRPPSGCRLAHRLDNESLYQDATGTAFTDYVQIGGRRYRYGAMIEGSTGFELHDETEIGGTWMGDVEHRDGSS